jgi:hypothetical protein
MRSSRRGIYEDSICEFRARLAWARRLALRCFIAAIVLLVGELAAFGYLVTHASNGAVSAPFQLFVANLWSTFGLAAIPVILLFLAGHALLNHISRTHDELSTADVKRGASVLADDPASRARQERLDSLINSISSIETPSPEPSGKTLAKIVNTVISGVSAGAAIGPMIVSGIGGALIGSILGGIVGALAQEYVAKVRQHADSAEKSCHTDEGGAQ